jgi:carbamoyl-phosphate synthase large subunit
MRTLRILLGSCGGLTGLYLSKLFRKSKYANFEIYGFDAQSKNPTKFFVDKFFILPNSSSEKLFLDALINLLNKEKIDIYFPLHSKEIRVISKFEDKIRNLVSARFIVSPYQSFLVLDNKRTLYESLSKLGLRAPKIYSNKIPPSDEDFPIFFKPESGSGSKGTMIIDTKAEFEILKKERGLFLELLKGTEYTVDMICDQAGNLLGYNQRTRIKTLGGAAVITENNYEIDVGTYLNDIAKHFKIKGPANFQFFKTENNEVVFTDANLRFASGGLPLSVASGLNIPLIVVKLLVGDKIDPQECSPDKKSRIMYRYFEEIFEE